MKMTEQQREEYLLLSRLSQFKMTIFQQTEIVLFELR